MPDSSPFTEVEIRPGLRLSSSPALFIEALRTLVIADVHWGYALSQRAAGRLMPQWGDEDIGARMERLVAYYRPRQLVIAGDVIHAAEGVEAASSALAKIQSAMRVVCVGGNHDRRTAFERVEAHQEGAFFIHHGDRAREIPPGVVEIVGHHHPAATWSDGAGTSLKLPALVEGASRLILPAFSPWAGGVPWNRRLLAGERLWFIAPRRIFPWPAVGKPG